MAEVLAKLGGYAALVILGLGAAWQAFKHLSSKWLDSRFDEKLKNLEQQHEMSLRHLQSSIDRELDRARKLNAQEFDSLTEGWAVLHEAYWRVRQHTGRGRTVYEFQRMNEGQAEHFIENSDIDPWQKSDLRALDDADKRTAYFRTATDWLTLGKCNAARQKLVVFVDRNAIFMLPEIHALFDQIEQMIRAALTEFKIRLELPSDARRDFSSFEILVEKGEPLYRELEALIRDRLWSAGAVRP
ncbi:MULTISPECIES: hypothetical protein [unclassified Variovorax]|uniref:hypothetical protein n=1 Tax=unclassified Variovorax TaxID=663243 RepID=UPI001BD59119|nr:MULTISPECIES: hypothetical protein [unclassified Variovorax]